MLSIFMIMEKVNKMKKEEIRERGKYYGCMIALSGTLLCLILLMCTGCTTTRYVPVVEHRTDTVQITRQQRDSIWLHDSIYTHEYIQGDTTFIMRYRWHTKYIERQVHDTTYISKRDSIPIPCPYPVEVEVERELTWWQKTRLHIANILLYVLLFYGLVWGVRLFLKTHGW